MRLGCILVLIGVLFASSRAYIHHKITVIIGVLFASTRAYIHHTSTIMRINAIKVTWN